MYAVRLWSVRHARGLHAFYGGFEALLLHLNGLFRALGYERIERPTAAVEKAVKGLLFDCRMCGQCVLSSTGMSCPMNCPKGLRNGPCGGVRDHGNCEVCGSKPTKAACAYRAASRRCAKCSSPSTSASKAGLLGSGSCARALRS